MLKIDEAVPYVHELLRTSEEGSAVVVWEDGRILITPLSQAELPEVERAPGEPWIVAKFLVGDDIPDQEIRDRLTVGLSAGGDWHH
ncbi:MAG TPA: hypothetical protein VFY90_09950 [Tepidiformaceae bacterium]|nr:hypothetical protein [Tepidiformaceae bacterium]